MTGGLQKAIEIAAAAREKIAPAFAEETAAPGTDWAHAKAPSAGHCAAVSAIVASTFKLPAGVEAICVSATVEGISHWFTRLTIAGADYDVDVTGDQFGQKPVQAAPAGELHPGTRVRKFTDLNDETLGRAAKLARKAGLAA